MSVISLRRRPKHQPKHALFVEPEQSLPEMLAELAPDSEPVPHGVAVVPEGAYPYEDIPVEEALTPTDDDLIARVAPWQFTDPDVFDASVPVNLTAEPVIGNSIPAPAPAPAPEPPLPPKYRVPADSRVLFYTGAGWADALTAARIRAGEWDDVHALFNATMGRAVAGLATAAWNARDAISEAWREVCIGFARPDQIQPGWKRIRDEAAEAERRRKPSFTPALKPAPPTRPQPVLREHRSAA